MRAKPLDSRDKRKQPSATLSWPRPGDYRIGSAESRAAAKLMLIQRTKLSAYDADCYTLYNCAGHLGQADPDSHWMQGTKAYSRGREVAEALHGPIVPIHLDPDAQRVTFASSMFKIIHGRNPRPGEILRYDDIAGVYAPEKLRAEVERFQGAWARRIPDYACPIRYEDGKILTRRREGSWVPDLVQPAIIWRLIEDDALRRRTPIGTFGETIDTPQPTIEAVIFIESKDGKRRAVAFEPGSDSTRAD